MKLEERAQQATTAVRSLISDDECPRFDDIVRLADRSQRRRRATLAAAVLVVVFAAGALVALPRGSSPSTVSTDATVQSATMTDGRTWIAIRKVTAGLGADASIATAAQSANRLFFGGSNGIDASATARVWFSTDGEHWHQATVPERNGRVVAIAVSPTGSVLAIGARDSRPGANVTSFVWRSDDDGATFREIAIGDGVFGDPAPVMGRPTVETLVWHSGGWLAGGGANTGLAGLWRSSDGVAWESLPVGSNRSGAMRLKINSDGALVGYGINERWTAATLGTSGAAPQSMMVPPGYVIVDVAPDGVTAVGDPVLVHGQPTPLLRSADNGVTWTIDGRFAVQYPDARARQITTVGSMLIGSGYSGDVTKALPGAWYSTDGEHWQTLPDSLVTTVTGALDIIGAISGRVVMASADVRGKSIYLLTV